MKRPRSGESDFLEKEGMVMILALVVLLLNCPAVVGQGGSIDQSTGRIHSLDTERIHSFFTSLNWDLGSAEANKRSQAYLLAQAGLNGPSAEAAVAASREYSLGMDALRTLHFETLRTVQDRTARAEQVRLLLERRRAIALKVLEQLKKTLGPEEAAKLHNYLALTGSAGR